MNKIFLGLIVAGLITFTACQKDLSTTADGGFALTAESVECTEAWLNLRLGRAGEYTVTRDDTVTLFSGGLGRDTLLYDYGLSPNNNYTYKAVSPNDGDIITIYITTLDDAAGHDYTWHFDTLAYPGSDQTLIRKLWGSSENDVYAVGHNDRSAGQIWHWDGNEWKNLVDDEGPIDPYYLRGGSFYHVFGTSKNDVWIVGGNVKTGYPDYLRGEIILHYDGAEWLKKEFDGLGVRSGWANSTDDVWFGTRNAEFIHYDGVSWTTDSLEIKASITDIAGFSTNEVYAHVSEIDKQPYDTTTYYFMKYDGDKWNIIDTDMYTPQHTDRKFGANYWISPSSKTLYSSSKHIFKLSGTNWDIIHAEGGYSYGSNDYNIFTANYRDGVYHYNGNSWHKYVKLPKIRYRSVWASNKHVFITGYIFDGVQKSLIIRGIKK